MEPSAIKKKIGDAVSSAGLKIKGFLSSQKKQQDEARRIQRRLYDPQNAPQLPEVKTGVKPIDAVGSFARGIANDLIKSPYRFQTAKMDVEDMIAGRLKPTPQRLIKTAANLADLPLNFYGSGAVKNLAKQPLKQAVKAVVKKGTLPGAFMGAQQVLRDISDTETVQSAAQKLAPAMAMGAAFGTGGEIASGLLKTSPTVKKDFYYGKKAKGYDPKKAVPVEGQPYPLMRLSDKNMKIRLPKTPGRWKARIGDIVDHPELFKNYPDVKNLRVEVGEDMGNVQAYYDPANKKIVISKGVIDNPSGVWSPTVVYVSDGKKLIFNKNTPAEDKIKDILIHELTHWMQQKEGLPFGSTPSFAKRKAEILVPKKIKELYDEQQRLIKSVDDYVAKNDPTLEEFDAYQSKIDKEVAALEEKKNKLRELLVGTHDAYLNTPGEALAFDAGMSVNLSQRELDAVAPLSAARKIGSDPDAFLDEPKKPRFRLWPFSSSAMEQAQNFRIGKNYTPVDVGEMGDFTPINPRKIAAKFKGSKGKNYTPVDVRKINSFTPINTDEISAKFQGDEGEILKNYVKKMVVEQDMARDRPSPLRRLLNFMQRSKSMFVDFTSPITDALAREDAVSKTKLSPKDLISYKIDTVLRSENLASRFMERNGLIDIIKNVDDYEEFNQYLIAKRAIELAEKSPKVKTGRDYGLDSRLVQALEGKYAPYEASVRKYTNTLLDYLVEKGLVSSETADTLRSKYQNYVPLNRVFSDLELEMMQGNKKGGGVASISQQTVVQKLKGSERKIENPLESLIENTYKAFKQGTINDAARILVSFESLPDNPLSLRKIKQSEVRPGGSYITLLVDGKKVYYETTPDIAQAAKRMNVEQLDAFSRIMRIPTRVLQLGATGLNIPFILSNLVKDRITAVINSDKRVSATLLNPLNFTKALFSVLKKDELYDNWIASTGGGTVYDATREMKRHTIQAIRAKKDLKSNVLYTVRNPSQLLRTIEDVVGKAEELTRLEVYRQTYKDAIARGMSDNDATVLAANASYFTTANFSRHGEFGRLLSAYIPFFNAGIQGARSFIRSARRDPAATGAKIALVLGVPAAASVAWNLSDERRRAAYEDIPDYEKENNIIIMPPNPTQDKRGRYNAIKIPLPPGINGFYNVVRKSIEGIQNPSDIKDIARYLVGTVTPINPLEDPVKTLGVVTPQVAKPALETFFNKNMFTGRDIVPPNMQNLPKEQQVFDNTSATARLVAKPLNLSPLHVQNAVRTIGGGVGEQLLNAADTGLYMAGLAPKEQISGRNIPEQISQRFTSVAGGEKKEQLYQYLDKKKMEKAVQNNEIKQKIINNDVEGALKDMKGFSQQRSSAIIRSAKEEIVKRQLTDTEKILFSMSADELDELVRVNPKYKESADKIYTLKNNMPELPIERRLKTRRLRLRRRIKRKIQLRRRRGLRTYKKLAKRSRKTTLV